MSATALTHGPPPADPGPRTTTGIRRWLPLAVVLGILVIGAVAAGLHQPSTSSVTFAPNNPGPQGAMAAARILSERGVEIQPTRSASEALALAREGTTLLVAGANSLEPDVVAALADVEADLVLAHTPYMVGLDRLTSRVSLGSTSSQSLLVASCEDPDAVSAQRIAGAESTISTDDTSVEICFPTAGDDATRSGAYASWEENDRRVTVLPDFSIATNELLAEEGHAALVLRTLGRHDTVVWWTPLAGDTVIEGEAESSFLLLPPQARYLGLQVIVIAAVAAVWAGRRMGRVVNEPLPVVVRAAETTLGRGSLYRRSRSHGHAAEALRAGCVRRVAARLGLPTAADGQTVAATVAATTGRTEPEVMSLFFGPPPGTDSELLRLARALDTLESEVHRS